MLTTKPFNSRLNVARWIGQRQATFRFELVNGVTGEVMGDINPIMDNPPSINHDTSRTIKRQLNIALNRVDTEAINPVQDRIRVWMVIGGEEWPLGRYMFVGRMAFKFTTGRLGAVSMMDEMFIIDQQLSTAFTARGNTVDGVVTEFLSRFSVDHSIEATTFLGNGSWSAGTNGGQVLGALATQGDYFSPWLDNDGVFRMIRAFDPASVVADIDWDAGFNVIQGNVGESDDLLTAPNRFVVVSNAGAASDEPIVGTYDVPASAPHSVANRGFVITDTQDLQITDGVQAAAVARNLGLRQTIFERRDIATVPDPRHDSYTVIGWEGERWLELAWNMTLVEGALMNHSLRKAYS